MLVTPNPTTQFNGGQQERKNSDDDKDYETLRRENQIEAKHASKLRSTCNFYTNEYYNEE